MKTKYLSLLLIALTLNTTGALGQTVQYAFTNFAGLPGGPGNADGTGNAARFRFDRIGESSHSDDFNGVAVDNTGIIYVADTLNNTIRKITPAGEVTTLAGSAGQGGSTDGIGIAARFSGPSGVAVDTAGNVYVTDSGSDTIRKITPAGVVTTLAGSAWESGSTDGTGSTARFAGSSGVAVDSGDNIYVADTWNNTIRKITPGGVVTTLAGNASITNQFGQPLSGSADGSGSAAQFFYPKSVAVDTADNVYVADTYNHTIRKITPAGVVTTMAGTAGHASSEDGTGAAARFIYPSGVATDSAGNVYVADSWNNTIRKITAAGEVTTLAGLPQYDIDGNFVEGSPGNTDGTGTAARFNHLSGVAVANNGNIYVADTRNNIIRKVTSAGAVTTLAGSLEHYGSADGTGSAARFNYPSGVAVDSAGNVYVTDTFNSTIRKITPVGVVTTLAGSAQQFGSADGTASDAQFSLPYGAAVDRIDNVYVADSYNNTIRKITSGGVVTTLAGDASITNQFGQPVSGSMDGTGSAARFAGPSGVAVDNTGNVYVADTGNHTIRKITLAGMVTTLAGSAGQCGWADGTGSDARFCEPKGVAVDNAGNVHVADGNFTIRRITPAGVVTTQAGSAEGGSDDGTGSVARFCDPKGVAVDTAGNVYVADTWNSTIRKITPDGVVTTLAGTPKQTGGADGIGSAAQFSGPWDGGPTGVAVDSAGNIYVADFGNHRITKGTPLFRFQTSAGSLTISNGSFQMQLTGPFGSNAVLESSINLQAWTPIQTNTLPPDGVAVSLPLTTNQNQFFRARLTP